MTTSNSRSENARARLLAGPALSGPNGAKLRTFWDADHSGQGSSFFKIQGGADACPGLLDGAPSGLKFRHPDLARRKRGGEEQRCPPSRRWGRLLRCATVAFPAKHSTCPLFSLRCRAGFTEASVERSRTARRAIPTNDRLTRFPCRSGCLNLAVPFAAVSPLRRSVPANALDLSVCICGFIGYSLHFDPGRGISVEKIR